MSTTSARTVFVLGREVDGNREVVIVDANKEYSMNANTISEYSDADAAFPYEA